MEKSTGANISNAPDIITELATDMVHGISNGEQIANIIVDNVKSGDISNEDSGLVDALAYSPYHPADSTGSSSVKSPGNLPAEKMLEGERPTGSGTALKRMKSKLATHLGINTVTDAEMSTEMDNFVFRIGKELLTTGNDNYTRGTISNSKIQDFLKTNLGVNVKRGDIRPCVTMKVGDAQQMIDMWGRDVTEYAKGMGGRDEETGRCYLCGLHIVPFGSCPEMEHKYPATTAYTNMHHYRLLQVYKGYVREDETAVSMYTLWKRFVNNNSNLDNLKTLYNNINHDLLYDRDNVNSQYDSIFTNFWNTTMYVDEEVKPYGLSTDEIGNVRLFFCNFIKAWLMEFAYSHHICNQAKSDLNIWSDIGDLNTFIRDAKKRSKSAKDKKAEIENTQTQGKIKDRIVERADRTNDMFDHLNEVVTNYTKAYGNISHSVNLIQRNSLLRPGDSMTNFKNHAVDNVYNVSEAMIMLKALYYISKSDGSGSSSSVSSPKESAKENNKTAIQAKYNEVRQLEATFVSNELVRRSARQEEQKRGEQDKAFIELNNMVESYRTTYGEEPLSECVSKCITEGNMTEQPSLTPQSKKVKREAGTGGTRRRRPRSKRRRVSKKKKTRKRKARKTVHKRRSK